MSDLLLIAVAAATVNNVVLARLVGLEPLLATRTEPGDIPGRMLATTAALAITAGLCHALDHRVLVPLELPFLRIIGFLGVTVLTVALTSVVLRWTGRRLPLITTGSTVLAVVLLTTGTAGTLAGAVALGAGAGAGYGLVLFLFAGLGPRLAQAPVPPPLRGPALTLVTAGMLSLAFLGFLGVGT